VTGRVWESRDVLKRRSARLAVAGFLMALAVPSLASCRTAPGVAAYVGDRQVTVTELNTAVADRLSDPAIAAYAKGKKDDFTRRVLTLLVQQDVYAAAAEHFHVQVSDADVRARIKELLGTDDPATVYGQLAQQGIGVTDVFENVRQQLVRQKIAEAKGIGGSSESELRARYEQEKPTLSKVRLGYITVPDQATATAVLAHLDADPASYAAFAARYKGQYTLPALEETSPDQIPGPLTALVAKAKPNTGFTLPVAEVGGVIVGFVGGTVVPTFEEQRAALEKEASDAADTAAAQVISQFQKSLDVTVNPRYGALKNGQLQPDDSGVVKLTGATSSAAPATSAAGGGN
jgi:hypothetical protein